MIGWLIHRPRIAFEWRLYPWLDKVVHFFLTFINDSHQLRPAVPGVYFNYKEKENISWGTHGSITISHVFLWYPNSLQSPQLIVHRVNENHPIDIMNANIPTNKPLWTLLVGAAPVKGEGLAVVVPAEVVFVADVSLGWASPRQLAILKKISMLPYTPPKSSWQGPIAKTGTSVKEWTPRASFLIH